MSLMMDAAQDFNIKHPDDIEYDDEDEDDCSEPTAAADSLSELSSHAPSSTQLVTPHRKNDVVLKKLQSQISDWDELQTPSKVAKESTGKSEENLLALADVLKQAMLAEQEKIKKQSELPMHAFCLN